MHVANDRHVPLVVQGGNTGLVGGGVPDAGGGEVLLSLKRMAAVRDDVSGDGFSLGVEAGVTLQAVQEMAKARDRLFPLSLASEGTATIGGAISTNAGGVHVLKYGTMRSLILGLEAVLPTGEIYHGLTRFIKTIPAMI
ncbi:FAD-binding oxidoreductase [Iodidimonas gelatinilytica]|uniref:FAD-binding oxidoreductase n=1 Tax=Iodidimonas gelatinilytica TaxID=1236966 RepID=UPI001B2FEAF8|nr:FAD-binding oxidoreductase [Iodidimonas gelatinilytica]